MRLDFLSILASIFRIPQFISLVVGKFPTVSVFAIGTYCVSAWNKGADSHLMILRGGVALVPRRISVMASNLRLSSLIPAGLIVDDISESETTLVVSARSKASEYACPLCGTLSGRIHSRYVRTAADLPCAGKKVELRLLTRRFVCNAPLCRRRIFAEGFQEGLLLSALGQHRGWSVSFIISDWHWATVRPPTLLSG